MYQTAHMKASFLLITNTSVKGLLWNNKQAKIYTKIHHSRFYPVVYQKDIVLKVRKYGKLK